MHHGKRHLNQKFPKVPDPNCTSCGARMQQIKVLKQEPTGTNTTLTCQTDCGACGQRHLGHRVISIKGKHMRFVSQHFDPLPRIPRYALPAALATLAALATGGYFLFG